MEDSTVWDFKMWPVAVLTGDCINEGFSQETAWQFCWATKSGLIMRWPYYRGGSKAGFHCMTIVFFFSLSLLANCLCKCDGIIFEIQKAWINDMGFHGSWKLDGYKYWSWFLCTNNVFFHKMGTFVDKKWKENFTGCYIFAFWIFFFEKKGACTP